MDEIIVRFGFDGIVDRKTTSDSEIIKILRKYVKTEKIVVLPVKAKDYQMLSMRASRNNMSIDEYIEFFGFKKENNRLDEIFNNKYDEIEYELSLLSNEFKEVYLDTKSDLYKRLYPFSKHRNMSIDELIIQFGYKRIVKGGKDEIYTDDNSKIILFNEIKEIVGSMERTADYQDKVIRSSVLVEKIKELYDHKCQLCNHNNPIPLIMKQDGTYYVEVHHITPISEGYDDEITDTYKNTLVLCAHHHKVVHFQNGGYNKIIKSDNKNYLW